MQIFIRDPNDCPSGIPGGLEKDFSSEKGQIAVFHGGARRGTNGCFQPMRTRQVGGMAFVIPLTDG